MSTIRPKQGRLQLDSASYAALRLQVLQRDGWRCQFCGGMSNLEVHHQRFRSQLGPDSEDNLITLCTTCHKIVHGTDKSALANSSIQHRSSRSVDLISVQHKISEEEATSDEYADSRAPRK